MCLVTVLCGGGHSMSMMFSYVYLSNTLYYTYPIMAASSNMRVTLVINIIIGFVVRGK